MEEREDPGRRDTEMSSVSISSICEYCINTFVERAQSRERKQEQVRHAIDFR